jgi:hypothetical protein
MRRIKIQPGKINAEAPTAVYDISGWKLLSIAFLMLVMLLWASAFSLAEDGQGKVTGGIGILDRIAEEVVVIDDVLYRLASDVIFYENDKRYTYISRSAFIVGTPVGFKFNENGEIAALWISK